MPDEKLASQYRWASKSVKNPIEDCLGTPLNSTEIKAMLEQLFLHVISICPSHFKI